MDRLTPGWRGAVLALRCAACLCAAFLAGCSPEHYRKSADDEVHRIIDGKAALVLTMPRGFRVEDPEHAAGAPQVVRAIRAGEDVKLTLMQAVAVSAAGSREYRSRREDVYLEALGLTLERDAFRNEYSGALSFMFGGSRSESKTGGDTSISDEQALSEDASLGLSRKLAGGGTVALSLSANFVQYLFGDPRRSLGQAIDVAVRQPLWRGAGRRIAREGLTQAERDMIYELRDFVRFRRRFFVDVATEFYQVLRQKDIVGNERVNLDSLRSNRERAQEMANAGRLPEFQVRQAEQNELNARERWVRAVQNYETRVDEFKITLGLHTDVPLELDSGELGQLGSIEDAEAQRTRDDVVKEALDRRLDLTTVWDRVEDSRRKVEVARDNLRPGLDLVLGTGASRSRSKGSDGGVTTTLSGDYEAGLEMDLGLERTSERNSYRSALITLDRRTRDLSLLTDQIRNQIYSAWRRLEEARESYRIQKRSVELAEGRVESTTLLLDAGRVEVRDLLDAQDDLVQARNRLTSAMVDFRIAMLELWRDMEVLAFEDGEFKEITPDESDTAG